TPEFPTLSLHDALPIWEGVACTVVMPAHAPRSKVGASRAYGADVVLHGSVFEAFEKCEALRREHGFTLVHPFDDPDIIAGQGTRSEEHTSELQSRENLV